MLTEKYKMGHVLTVYWLQKAYSLYGVAHIATDGIYVQIEKEPTASKQIGSTTTNQCDYIMKGD